MKRTTVYIQQLDGLKAECERRGCTISAAINSMTDWWLGAGDFCGLCHKRPQETSILEVYPGAGKICQSCFGNLIKIYEAVK